MNKSNLEILWVWETRTKTEGEEKIHEDFKYRFKGNDEGRHGIDFVLSPSMAEKVNKIIYEN